ncbi:MAG: hypothetical protein IJ071_11630 [Ruminococcus sp.]|nr:hypothetical protein [Ruminococcus sp.]
MEVILALIIIIVLLTILGVKGEMIVAGIIGLICLGIGAMGLMFLYMCIRLMLSKRRKAQFVRIDTAPKGGFKVAYYAIDGAVYPCVFPSEMILNDKMYRPERTYTVMYSRRMGKVFDIWTILTCVLGLICSAFMCGGIVYLLIGVFR